MKNNLTIPIFDLRRNLRSHAPSVFDGWKEQDFFDEYLKIQMKKSNLSKSQKEKVINYVRIKNKNK
jgi:hypothetical protein